MAFSGTNYSQQGYIASPANSHISPVNIPPVNIPPADETLNKMKELCQMLKTDPRFTLNLGHMLNMLTNLENDDHLESNMLSYLEANPQYNVNMNQMLEMFNQKIIPLMDTVFPNMETMLNMLYLEIIPQFGANMKTMLRMYDQETNRDPEDPEYDPQYGYNMLSWIIALSSEFAQGYWTRLQKFLKKEREDYDIFPPEEEVFTWMKYRSLDQIKVVIIGQDPYPNPGEAHGLCFSVKTHKKTQSLNKIFEELEYDVEGFVIPSHGDLTKWAEQGVLLLNAVLTVRSGKSGSHENRGWEIFTNRVISLISERNPAVVFLLWGKHAKRKRPLIDEPRHKVLTARHPAALPDPKKKGDIEFLGCGHFSETNAWLAERNLTGINWQI